MLECVVNISEGCRDEVIETIGAAGGDDLLDLHRDAHHNRSVLTLVGEQAPRSVALAAVELIDLRDHDGVHPRIGAVDVVPFVPLAGSTMSDAMAARDRFAAWAGEQLAVPCFTYGIHRTLPEVRRSAFTSLEPDTGPPVPHPSAGAIAVGARNVLVAYNLWLESNDLALAKALAAQVRGPHVRTLGLAVGDQVQVSMNLIAPGEVGPAQVWDAVAAHTAIRRAELVGLVPEAVLHSTDPQRWNQLDLSADRTIEARLAERDDRRPAT